MAVERPDGALYSLSEVGFAVDDQAILSDLNFELPAGQISLITGPSGSGKSTLLKLLTYLAAPSCGQIYYQGTRLNDMNPVEYRSRAIMLGQKPLIIEGSVMDNMCLPFSLRSNRGKVASMELFAESLAKVDLPASYLQKRASKLSGGEGQRMALARAVSLQPETLLLDEPTAALDISSEGKVLDFLNSLKGQINLVIVAHSVAYLELVDRVIILKNGRLNKNTSKLNASELKQILGEKD
jgi:putative ABC transport system ATP-binding protein